MSTPPGSMAYPPPVDVDNLGQGPVIMGITWLFQIVALIAVFARFMVRRKQAGWGWDDYIMLAAVLLQLALQALATNSFIHGMGKHDHSLTLDQMILILKHNWVSVPPGILVGLLSRTSIAIVLIHLFSVYKWFTYYLISFTSLMWVAGIVEMPMPFVQVTPVEALWNFTLPATPRVDKRAFLYSAYFFQSCCTFSDFTYAFFPVCFVWKLNMPLAKKIGLMLVMGGSIFSMAMSILKTLSLGQIANASPTAVDPQYKSSPQLIYGYAEQCTVIIMGCIPFLRHTMKLDFSKMSLKRLYSSMYKKSKSSTSEYDSNGYTDLDTDPHKLSHLNSANGVTKASVGTGSLSGSDTLAEGKERYVPGQITRTDNYSITYDQKERIPKESV